MQAVNFVLIDQGIFFASDQPSHPFLISKIHRTFSFYLWPVLEVLFMFVFSAYEVLSDEQKRHQYDQFGEEGLKGEGFRTGSFNFDDLFKDFGFGFGEKNNGNRQGNGNNFKFSFGEGFNDFFKMDDDDFNNDDDDGESIFDGFGGFGDFGDSFFGHHRNGDGSHSKHIYRESSSGMVNR